MRVAYLFVPHFPVAVETRERPELRGRPVVVGGAPEDRKAVVDCSPDARRCGVRRGMPLREALSRCSEAVFLTARPTLYRDVAAAMHRALDQVSPLVEPVEGAAGPGRFFVGLLGLLGLHASEEALAHALARAVEEAARLTPRVGVADGKFAAFAGALVAKAQRPYLVPPGKAVDFLVELPVSHLPVSVEMQRRLRLLGIQRMGQLAALSLSVVQAEFGPEGRLAWNLIRGVDDPPIVPPAPPTVVAQKIALPAPVATSPVLLVAAQHLLGRLLSRPECHYQAARRLVFRATLTSGEVWERVLTFREPRSALAPILEALRGRIVDAALPAPVEDVE